MERLPETWLTRLPLAWQYLVVAPARIESFHDDSIPASKWRGYDRDGELCYYHHSYTLWQESFDDEDTPCMRQIEAESLEAWRCADGRWLRRLLRMGAPGDCARHGLDAGTGTGLDRGFELVSAREIPRL